MGIAPVKPEGSHLASSPWKNAPGSFKLGKAPQNTKGYQKQTCPLKILQLPLTFKGTSVFLKPAKRSVWLREDVCVQHHFFQSMKDAWWGPRESRGSPFKSRLHRGKAKCSTLLFPSLANPHQAEIVRQPSHPVLENGDKNLLLIPLLLWRAFPSPQDKQRI